MKYLARFGMMVALIIIPIILIGIFVMSTYDTFFADSAISASADVPVETSVKVITTRKSYNAPPVEKPQMVEINIEEPAIEDSETTESTIEDTTNESTNPYNFSSYDMDMICAVVISETGYCDAITQKAVAHTIINRYNRNDFPNTIYGILTQENQYTAINNYFNYTYKEGLAPGSDAWYYTMSLCEEALTEWDFTGGAVAYYNPDVCGYDSWFESLTLTYADNYHRFFTW